jgi:hypothetical protein
MKVLLCSRRNSKLGDDGSNGIIKAFPGPDTIHVCYDCTSPSSLQPQRRGSPTIHTTACDSALPSAMPGEMCVAMQCSLSATVHPPRTVSCDPTPPISLHPVRRHKDARAVTGLAPALAHGVPHALRHDRGGVSGVHAGRAVRRRPAVLRVGGIRCAGSWVFWGRSDGGVEGSTSRCLGRRCGRAGRNRGRRWG